MNNFFLQQTMETSIQLNIRDTDFFIGRNMSRDETHKSVLVNAFSQMVRHFKQGT